MTPSVERYNENRPAPSEAVLERERVGSAGWQTVVETPSSGGSLPSGVATPLGSVTPSGIGELYVETGQGALWIAIGLTSADWIVLGGQGSGSYIGVAYAGGSINIVNDGQPGDVGIFDAVGNSGSGNGFYFKTTGVDGEQHIDVYLQAGGVLVFQIAATGEVSVWDPDANVLKTLKQYILDTIP